jgi:hypothetical protein
MAGRYTSPDQRRGVKDYGREGRRRSAVAGQVAPPETPLQTEDGINMTDESGNNLVVTEL